MSGSTVRICRCGCGKALPVGAHGNARNHPDCLAEVRKRQNRQAAKKARQARRGFTGQVAEWPDVHLPAVYALEITALAAHLVEEAFSHASEQYPGQCDGDVLTLEEAAEGSLIIAQHAQALLSMLASRLPAPAWEFHRV